jgi:hypothetical protein
MDPGDFEELYNELKRYPFTEEQSLTLKMYFDKLYNSTYELNRIFDDSEKAYIQDALNISPHAADRTYRYQPAARPLDFVDIQYDSNSNSNRNSSKHAGKRRRRSNSKHTKKRKRSNGSNTAKKTKK